MNKDKLVLLLLLLLLEPTTTTTTPRPYIMSSWIKQELYGGAITTVIPKTFLDASMLRQVPDTQEVFVNSRRTDEPTSDNLGFNESIIVDLLQRVDETDDRKALEVHLEEVTSLDESSGHTIVTYNQQDNWQSCVAVETAYKWGKESLKETVVLCLGLLRLAEFETDVLISVLVPISSDDEAEHSAMEHAATTKSSEALPPRVVAAYGLLQDMMKAFKVEDPSLFA